MTALLDATARVLQRDGYARASTNRIAEKAGVNIGSLYQYFPTKDALIGALIDRHLEEVSAVLATSPRNLEACRCPRRSAPSSQRMFASTR